MVFKDKYTVIQSIKNKHNTSTMLKLFLCNITYRE